MWPRVTMTMDLSAVVGSLRSLCIDVSSLREGTTVPCEALESLQYGLERAYRELLAYEILAGDSITREHSEGIDFVRAAMRIVRGATERAYCIEAVEPTVRGRGRPRLMISREQLQLLIETNFTTPQIAHMLGVSLSTVRRRMELYNLSVRATYATISNQELDQLIREISRFFPMCGSKQMAGHLLSRGFRIQQSRIRESLRRVDPQGVVMRQLTVTRRRQYSVPAPLSLYHIDGNHKLIR